VSEPAPAICVFAGSSPGARPQYAAAARALGRELASRELALVYGGGNVGLMGILADAVIESGGTAVGVIPSALADKRLGHDGLTALHVVATMHERKALMADLAQAFIALPGGIGTLEELFEAITWAQLGIHAKPCGLLNAAGYYDPLLRFLDSSVENRFVHPEHRDMIHVAAEPELLLDRLLATHVPVVEKWIDR